VKASHIITALLACACALGRCALLADVHVHVHVHVYAHAHAHALTLACACAHSACEFDANLTRVPTSYMPGWRPVFVRVPVPAVALLQRPDRRGVDDCTVRRLDRWEAFANGRAARSPGKLPGNCGKLFVHALCVQTVVRARTPLQEVERGGCVLRTHTWQRKWRSGGARGVSIRPPIKPCHTATCRDSTVRQL
jgi:hypothetical protein